MHDILAHGARRLALARVHVANGLGPGFGVRHGQVHDVAPAHVAGREQRRQHGQVRARVLGIC